MRLLKPLAIPNISWICRHPKGSHYCRGGSYVSVDIFYVISGFLITSIIWRELHGGTFSLANFYLRRIRRTTLLAGAFLLLPDALERLPLSLIFSSASAANIYFRRYLDDDYFA